MLAYLRGKATDRQLRLLAAAFCRHVWELITDTRSRRAVEVAEGFADDTESKWQLRTANRESFVAFQEMRYAAGPNRVGMAHLFAAEAASLAAAQDRPALEIAAGAWALSSWALEPSNRDFQHEPLLANLCRDIFSFRSVAADPAWLAWNNGTVRNLAQAIYTDRAFDRLPILADALEDAGCTNADILAHCRGGGEHVRGCWVVDLILGKM